MIEMLFCFGAALGFLALSYNVVDENLYEKYYTLFFILNTVAWMILFILGAYLIIPLLITGEIYV